MGPGRRRLLSDRRSVHADELRRRRRFAALVLPGQAAVAECAAESQGGRDLLLHQQDVHHGAGAVRAGNGAERPLAWPRWADSVPPAALLACGPAAADAARAVARSWSGDAAP